MNRELSQRTDRDGYKDVGIVFANGKRHMRFVHQLVALTFIGEPDSNMTNPTVDHINGVRDDNRVENLRWLSKSDNSRLKINPAKGENHPAVKLTEDDVRNICVKFVNGMGINEIAREYNVNQGAISHIYNRNTWRHISKDYDWESDLSNRLITLSQAAEITRVSKENIKTFFDIDQFPYIMINDIIKIDKIKLKDWNKQHKELIMSCRKHKAS